MKRPTIKILILGVMLFTHFACNNENETNSHLENQNLFSEVRNEEQPETIKVVSNPRFVPVVLPAEDNTPLNEGEFNSTMDWIKGKACENISYQIENGEAYEIINSLTNNGTICTYSTFAKKYGSRDNELVSYYRFNLKDITSFEINNPDTYSPANAYMTIKLKCVNSDYKIKWTKWFLEDDHKPKDLFEKYDQINELDIYFNYALEKKRVSKAFTDLLKFAGSKKEKY
jgi:hypothetical protein